MSERVAAGQVGPWDIRNITGDINWPSGSTTIAAILEILQAKDFATQTTLAQIKAKTDNLDVALSTRTKPSDLQKVTAIAFPLPPGAATEVTLANLDAKDFATQATLALIKAKTDNLDVLLSTRTKPADPQHTIIDSGTTAVTNAGVFATQAAQAGNWFSRLLDGSGNLISSTAGSLDVNITGGGSGGGVVDQGAPGATPWLVDNSGQTQPVSGTFWQATQPVSGVVIANAGTNLNTSALATEATLALLESKDFATETTLAALAAEDFATQTTLALIKAKTDNIDVALSTRTKPADTQVVSVASLPLPAGASTEATLALIKAKTDNIDVALSTRTKPTDQQHVIIDSGGGGGTVDQGNPGALPWLVDNSGQVQPVSGTFWQATQPISGTVTANAGTNLNTSALALEGGGNLAALVAKDFSTEATLALIKAKTDNLDVLLSTRTKPADTQPVSAAALPLPTGAATETTLAMLNSKVTTVDTGAVVISAALPAGTNAIGKLAANSGVDIGDVDVVSCALPTGASTAANQATIIGHVDGIETLLGTTNTNTGSAATSLGVMDDWDNAASDGASISGDVAHAATDAGEPVKVGGVAKTANPTAVTDGQRVNAIFDKLGKQICVGAIRDLKGKQVTTITSSTTETTIVTAAASTFLDLYGLILTNTSATVTKVTIRDATAGGTPFVLEVPATDTRGFMLPVDSAIPQATVNNNWTAQCGTSVAALEVTALFVKNT